jgi:PadR family transcriptional regulator, regulatory protein PadR
MPGHDAQMLKGVLSLLLLQLVAEQEDYGYSLVLRLQGRGFADLSEGTVYPALSRMESHGLLGSRLQASSSGPARKYYSISPAGTSELTRALLAWRSLVDTVDRIVPTPTSARSRS